MLFTAIFCIAAIWVAWKMLKWGLKAAWGLARLICTVFLLPLFLIGLVCVGLIYVAVPILIIVGIIAVVGGATRI